MIPKTTRAARMESSPLRRQVEEVDDDHHEPAGVFGPYEYDEHRDCFMVSIHKSEHERVNNKVLNVLADDRPNKGIVDCGVISQLT